MKQSNVEKVINIGVDLESSKKSIEMSRKFDGMYAAIGIHPTESLQCNDVAFEELRSLILGCSLSIEIVQNCDVSQGNNVFSKSNLVAGSDVVSKNNVSAESMASSQGLRSSEKKVVAIGEIGLDYYRMQVPREVQQEAFRKQLRLAKEFQLPVIIHCREAYEDTFQILIEEAMEKVVFHCFAGDLSFAKKVWERGFYTSFTGIITYPNAQSLREVVRAAPFDRIMVETDCPFLPPQSHRGKRNEPSFLPEIVEKIEEIRNSKDIFQSLYRNSELFYNLS